jgi:flavin reductase (DIM6/NTAB) family NADH-FMN oxidoreductase RutF
MAGVTRLTNDAQPALEDSPANSRWYRHVLGHFPTGVCVITAAAPDGSLSGMAVGSFTSVSLDPPLVGFFPDRSSTSWPRIGQAGRFCVNVLSADQESLSLQFASKIPDKFKGLEFRRSRAGNPVLAGVVAWIDCEVRSVSDCGDHFLVLGHVIELHVEKAAKPLVFWQGRHGAIATPVV